MDIVQILPILLAWAWLVPLGSFGILLFLSPQLDRHGRGAGWLATAAIAVSFLLCAIALGLWIAQYPSAALGGHPDASSHAENPFRHTPVDPVSKPMVGQWYTLAQFGSYQFSIGYYIDTLTLLMCTMVTLVAMCIHIYSLGYMSEELDEVTDVHVLGAEGRPLRRPGRFGRFFQYLSLFSFSMLGLVLAGNLVMVFVFWELVGLCSYFLIGFYRERPSANQAAMKAFVVNRVGDFGFLVGLMALGGLVGNWSFADSHDATGQVVPGIFSQVGTEVFSSGPSGEFPAPRGLAGERALWILAAVGIFCGCVGKSAQFPLHVWLPDAMEGPTPVSALIHAATMVAAGVYLVGRFYPAFPPEVLLGIACVGCMTLVIGATIALVATDMKRVLAYSTISQLGYMMLGLGVGGWVAGLFHLLTHAFFKALLFLGAGSVIHAVGTNEMPQMGGLARKMPWTAVTMLIGCLAIAGAGIPGLIGLSGFYSKEAILAQVYLFWDCDPRLGVWLFWAAVIGAGLTAFYMFRLWYMTFVGEPRDEHLYAHAHESPRTMLWPLAILALFSIVAGGSVPGTPLSLPSLLEQGRPGFSTVKGASGEIGANLAEKPVAASAPDLLSTDCAYGVSADFSGPWTVIPDEHRSHDPAVAGPVGWLTFTAALIGFLLATVIYGLRRVNPARVAQMFPAVYTFLKNKWYFDEAYDRLIVRPVLWLAARTVDIDRYVWDGAAEGMAIAMVQLARLDDWLDRRWVDGFVNRFAQRTYTLGLQLCRVQTGRVRQYILWMVLGTVGIFVWASLW